MFWKFSVFFVSGIVLGVIFVDFGSRGQKVDANFDRKTGMQVNPANPGKSRDGGSGALKELSIRPPLDSKAPGGTPHRG